MAKFPIYIKVFATAEQARNLLAGPDNSQGKRVSIYDIVNQGITSGEIDITPDAGAVVTVDGTQTITGNKTLSGTLTASNASITLSSVPTYADNAAALAGGLTAGRLYKTAAGDLLITVPA